MNQVAEELYSIYESSAELTHYGMPRRSGRYPWGSGEDPYQHGRDFLSRVDELKKSGWSETPENIKSAFGLSTTEYRKEKANAVNERSMLNRATAKSLKEDGLGPTAIARQMSERLGYSINESTVRGWLNENTGKKTSQARETADALKKIINERGMIDVGLGVEVELGISRTKLDQALKLLEEDGYPTYSGRFDQVTNRGSKTTQKVLCPPGTEHKEIYDLSKVNSLVEYTSKDGGATIERFKYPSSLDSKRLKIRYADEAGADGVTGIQKDGIIELRRGVDDLSLSGSRYSQVRIMVDGTHYLKGVAVYSDDMPDGVDVIFNTNKGRDKGKMECLKEIKKDPDNPFGALIKGNGQYEYTAADGTKKLSPINKTREEGDWSDWSDGLPSQFLSKQSLSMAKKQLGIAQANKEAEYAEICALTNPTIKKHLLTKFADECDSSAVTLKAAALPGQKYHVLIPMNNMKDDEVYAPRYADGTKLALVRYPHGGTFEIPICTVNNKNAVAKKLLGADSYDAIGVTSKVAGRLSGADFDGDTAMCIPTHDRQGKVKITSTKELDGLAGFEPKEQYGGVKQSNGDYINPKTGVNYHLMKDERTGKDSTQSEMGKISNLITDMTLAGADSKEMARAVRHSMVVIDAGKHHLDYKQSEIDNNIKALKKEYQHHVTDSGRETDGGASTLISRAKGQASVIKRQGSPKVNLKTNPDYDPSKPEGSLIWKQADNAVWETPSVNKRTGAVTMKTHTKTQRSTKMAETEDAYSLLSEARHPMEIVYADYANSMKSLARKARVEQSVTGKIAYDKNAKAKYSEEVRSLNQKLDVATQNKPKEREAQRRANVVVQAKIEADPHIKTADIKKASQQALKKYRNEVSSVATKDRTIEITDREWEAIQSGAVSEHTLTRILNNTGIDALRARATPKATKVLSDAKISQIKAMSQSYTIAQLAEKFNVSAATVTKYLKGAK